VCKYVRINIVDQVTMYNITYSDRTIEQDAEDAKRPALIENPYAYVPPPRYSLIHIYSELYLNTKK